MNYYVSVVLSMKQIFFKFILINIKILGCVYIPPNATTKMYTNHCDIIESLFFSCSDHYFIITGDLN